DPLDPKTKMGAIVDKAQMEKVLSYIEAGRREGAKLRFGGNRVLAEKGGYFVELTVFEEVDNRMKIAQEEIFGPVLATIAVKDLARAITVGNVVSVGLAAAGWTPDITRAHKAAPALRAGVVWVNCLDPRAPPVPFGGYKQSGFRRDKSLHALVKY